MVLVLHSINQVIFCHYLTYNQFLLLQLMLDQIFHQHKHLNKVELIEFDLRKRDKLHIQ